MSPNLRKRKRQPQKRKAELGNLLRQIRLDSGESIKSAAPLLQVDYTYLSKIENGVVAPSSDLLSRLAGHFKTDVDTLFLAAGRLPPDIEMILKRHPKEVMTVLRERFSGDDGG